MSNENIVHRHVRYSKENIFCIYIYIYFRYDLRRYIYYIYIHLSLNVIYKCYKNKCEKNNEQIPYIRLILKPCSLKNKCLLSKSLSKSLSKMVSKNVSKNVFKSLSLTNRQEFQDKQTC